jgi:hypothetical protein
MELDRIESFDEWKRTAAALEALTTAELAAACRDGSAHGEALARILGGQARLFTFQDLRDVVETLLPAELVTRAPALGEPPVTPVSAFEPAIPVFELWTDVPMKDRVTDQDLVARAYPGIERALAYLRLHPGRRCEAASRGPTRFAERLQPDERFRCLDIGSDTVLGLVCRAHKRWGMAARVKEE